VCHSNKDEGAQLRVLYFLWCMLIRSVGEMLLKKKKNKSSKKYVMTIIANVIYYCEDEERKLCDMLLADVLSIKNIVMANRCIDM
jgi:DNA-directed RNA polymerase specialized sigma54-like protein